MDVAAALPGEILSVILCRQAVAIRILATGPQNLNDTNGGTAALADTDTLCDSQPNYRHDMLAPATARRTTYRYSRAH